MTYDEKTKKIKLDELEEVLEELRAAADQVQRAKMITGAREKRKADNARPKPPPIPRDARSVPTFETEPTPPDSQRESSSLSGVGVYGQSARDDLSKSVGKAAVRYLVKSYRLLTKLRDERVLTIDERKHVKAIEAFLMRNRII